MKPRVPDSAVLHTSLTRFFPSHRCWLYDRLSVSGSYFAIVLERVVSFASDATIAHKQSICHSVYGSAEAIEQKHFPTKPQKNTASVSRNSDLCSAVGMHGMHRRVGAS
jgi:hypothetical protein